MDVMAALGDPVRRRILEVLIEHPEDAGTLASRFPISRPAVSRHLRVLRECGLVRSEADAQRRIYHAVPAPLAEVDAWLAKYRPFWADKLDALGEYLEQENQT